MEQFMERLVRSRTHFEEFARKQASMGVDIYTPPINDAPTHAARWAHRDSKDGVLMMAVEHKRRGISFTDRASFPYDTVIVDEVYKIDRKDHPCLIYICENAAGYARGCGLRIHSLQLAQRKSLRCDSRSAL